MSLRECSCRTVCHSVLWVIKAVMFRVKLMQPDASPWVSPGWQDGAHEAGVKSWPSVQRHVVSASDKL